MNEDEPSVDSLDARAASSFYDPRATRGRSILAIILGGLSLLLTPSELPWRIRAVAAWDTAALTFLILAWMMIVSATPPQTKQRAALEDPGRHAVFLIALGASLFSLFAAVFVLRRLHDVPPEHARVWTALATAAVPLSWLVTHTVYTFRYAHMYYRRRVAKHCLCFPGDQEPADIDFAYFSFTIGMTFQVSDVAVQSRGARRAVLVHSLVSFIYNTTILAITLNLLTSMLS